MYLTVSFGLVCTMHMGARFEQQIISVSAAILNIISSGDHMCSIVHAGDERCGVVRCGYT
jgi:hypothetical protein